MRNGIRSHIKRALGAMDTPLRSLSSPTGSTILIYHRIGDDTADELDLPASAFQEQVKVLSGSRVVSLDRALDDLDAGVLDPSVVLTFDDGFSGVYDIAWPALRAAELPFTVYVASAYIGGMMQWPGSTAKGQPGKALTWAQLEELAASPLVTIGNHTHTHVPAHLLGADELDRCSEMLESRLQVQPRHFAYTWGELAPQALPALRARFRSAAAGSVGRNVPSTDRHQLHRVPVRATDPLSFFRAKVQGTLVPEVAYERLVRGAKRLGLGA